VGGGVDVEGAIAKRLGDISRDEHAQSILLEGYTNPLFPLAGFLVQLLPLASDLDFAQVMRLVGLHGVGIAHFGLGPVEKETPGVNRIVDRGIGGLYRVAAQIVISDGDELLLRRVIGDRAGGPQGGRILGGFVLLEAAPDPEAAEFGPEGLDSTRRMGLTERRLKDLAGACPVPNQRFQLIHFRRRLTRRGRSGVRRGATLLREGGRDEKTCYQAR
jgi:hypothetical protein